MGTRSTNTDAGVDSKQKQTHTHIRARRFVWKLHSSCKQGRVNFKCWTAKKIVTFNEFYYIAFTPTLTQKQTPKSLVKTMARVFFKGNPGWRKQKTKKKQINCTALYFWKKNRTKQFATFERIALKWKTNKKYPEKKN